MSGLSAALGDFVVIQDLKVSDGLNSAGQTTFAASITVGIFAEPPRYQGPLA
jgi:hypothetical protein